MLTDMENKCCSKCKIKKPSTSEFFPKSKKYNDGLGYWCKSCLKVDYISKNRYQKKPKKEILPFKTCSKCNEVKLLNNFPPNKVTVDGVGSWCRICSRIATNNYHKSISAVYEIVDKSNVCLYIGKSESYIARRLKHLRFISNPQQAIKNSKQPHLYPLLNQHSNLNIRIIEECSPKMLFELEQYYIDTKKPLYNKQLV